MASSAFSTVVVANDIKVEGNSRISSEFIREKVDGSADLDAATKTLFQTGQFEDVRIRKSGKAVEIGVKEAPLVSDVEFNGNSRLKDAQLRETVTMKAGSAFTADALTSDVARVRSAYDKRGRLDAKIETQIDRRGDRVFLLYKIIEGPKSGIDTIYFRGNSSFNAADLRSVIKTRQSGLVSSLLHQDVYDVDQVDADREALRSFYVSKGYADATVSEPEVTYQPEAHTTSIGFEINEGPRYTLGSVNVDSTVRGYAGHDATARYRRGRLYTPKAVDKLASELRNEAAKATPSNIGILTRTSRNPNGTMDITYNVDRAENVYIERIDIVGNSLTKDYVIRREFDFSEGDRLDPNQIAIAERRLRALGFFRNLTIKTSKGSSDDRVLLTVLVDEQKTGEFSVGAGYSNPDGLMAEVGLSQKNFMGTGRGFNINVGRGEDTATYGLSLTEPHFLGTRTTAFFESYLRENASLDDDFRPYDEQLAGGRIGLKAPISEDLSATIYYAVTSRRVDDIDGKYRGSSLIAPGKSLNSLVGYTFDYNTLDDLTKPSEGSIASFDQQVAGLGGDAAFIRTEVRLKNYETIDERHDIIASLSTRAGHIAAFGDNDLSFFDHLRNDNDLVRGFERGGIGPRDVATGLSMGGQAFIAASAEATAPLAMVPEGLGLRGALFADVGTVFSADKDNAAKTGTLLQGNDLALRASVGAGIVWNSPIGVIRANFALPVVKEDYDRTQVFSFSAGTHF